MALKKCEERISLEVAWATRKTWVRKWHKDTFSLNPEKGCMSPWLTVVATGLGSKAISALLSCFSFVGYCVSQIIKLCQMKFHSIWLALRQVHSIFIVVAYYEQMKYINQGCCQFIQSQSHVNLPDIWSNSGLHCLYKNKALWKGPCPPFHLWLLALTKEKVRRTAVN